MTDNRKRQKGFTLIEIAIVLVIVGLLLGMGATLIGPLTRRVKNTETKELINSAVESVVSFTASSSSLPAAATFPAIVRKQNDIWGNSLVYIYDANLTGNLCGRTTTSITVNECFDAGCSSPVTTNNVAFIVLSEGENFNNQTEGAGAATGAVNVYSLDVFVDNFSGGGDPNRAEPNDDIVKWITIRELTAKVDCSGSELRILNNELPRGTVGIAYSATLFGDGGVSYSSGGQYRWCRQESSSSGVTFTPSTLSANCLGLAEASWGQANSIVLTGSASSSNSFNYTFFVRDDFDSSGSNDNIVQKTIVMTISP